MRIPRCVMPVAALLTVGIQLAVSHAATPAVTRLGPHLAVYPGPINVGILCDGPRALLVDCGDGSVRDVLAELGVRAVDEVLFTHHHRDQACGAGPLVEAGAKLFVPAGERTWFENVDAFWGNPKYRWQLTRFRPQHLTLAESLSVAGVLADGDARDWGPAKIQVLATPGHTDGSLSFLVSVDGRRVLFSGDAIYDEGQLWDLWSLQKGEQKVGDYHGFLGARGELRESLAKIRDAGAELLIPSHGRIMPHPQQAVDRLLARLETCYDRYVATSALRHYFPQMFTAYEGRPGHMPIRPGKPAPDCLRHSGTTWVLVSQDKAALVMDCWGEKVIKFVQDLVASGDVKTVEGLWVTHYHGDHVNGIPDFQKTFSCPCITDRHVAEVISDPLAWRLPCISQSRARVDRPTADGESWPWHEFRLTAFHFPGQTLYHAGLLVEGRGLRMLFVGDSFTMAGMDDYCMLNRTWLGAGVGLDHCLELIQRLQPTHLFNPHVNEAFDFTPEELQRMRANLAEREKLYGEIVPWDHANYGMDESWVRCHPYEQELTAGGEARLRVVFTNHSAEARRASARAVLPRRWPPAGAAPSAAAEASIPAKQEGDVELRIAVPAATPAGRYVVPVDVHYGPWTLPQFSEAILVVR